MEKRGVLFSVPSNKRTTSVKEVVLLHFIVIGTVLALYPTHSGSFP